MTIPKSRAGGIIGPGGQIIKRIMVESQAGIKIRGVNDDDKEEITITGTPEEVKMVEIRKLL